MCFAEGIAMAGAAVVKTHVLADEGVLLLAVVLPKLLFSALSVATWPGLFSPSPFFWPSVPT
jgi:hypothetical protein